MKYTNLRAFEKHIEGASPAHFSNIYMILVKDRFTRKMSVDNLLTALLKGQKQPELCLKAFEGENLSVESVMDELNGLTLFSERQVIAVELPEKPAKPLLTALESYCKNPSRSIFLVISAPAVNHSTNFYKTVEKTGIVLEIAEEKGREKERTLIEWISTKVAAAGKKIDPQAAHHLLQQVGTELSLLHNELEKLFCYVGDRAHITVQDISAICANINIETVWQLGEAIFRRDAPTALRISKAMLDDGTVFLSLVRQIRTQFQTEYQVCSILNNGGTSSDISKQFPYMTGFILDRHQKMAQAYGMVRFKKGMLHIDQLETLAKNSALTHEFLAEMLIIKLAI
jgi:DNA polymerase-3 subunit delta